MKLKKFKLKNGYLNNKIYKIIIYSKHTYVENFIYIIA